MHDYYVFIRLYSGIDVSCVCVCVHDYYVFIRLV